MMLNEFLNDLKRGRDSMATKFVRTLGYIGVQEPDMTVENVKETYIR